MKEKPIIYELEDKYMWDFWYIKAGDFYHAFYVQYDKRADKQYIYEKTSIGHATSRNLINWTEEATALEPKSGTWNDLGIATGSTICKDEKYFMIFTGYSTTNGTGMGLAESVDLKIWRKCGEEPIIPSSSCYSALWKGEKFKCYPLADAYIYPKAIDGWYYLVINSHVEGAPEGKRGCQLMLKSKNLIQWESHKIASYPKCFERMETAQIWEHGGHWYMLFGGVPDYKNYIYMSENFDGPYEPQEWSTIELPDGGDFYLGKVERDADGDSAFLANDCLFEEKRLLGKYKLRYYNDGKVSIHK